MPIYSFICNECGAKSDELLGIEDCERQAPCQEIDCNGVVVRDFAVEPPKFLWEKDLDDQWYYDAEDSGVLD